MLKSVYCFSIAKFDALIPTPIDVTRLALELFLCFYGISAVNTLLSVSRDRHTNIYEARIHLVSLGKPYTNLNVRAVSLLY